MIEIRQLRHFLAVVEHGGIRQAARAIPLSASAVGRSIAMLEDHYGVELLSRDKQQMTPTAFGERLAEDAKSLVTGFDGIGERLEQLTNLDTGTLRVGMGPSISAVLMPVVAARMARDYPRVQLEILYDHASGSVARMRAHELDVGVGLQDPFLMDGGCDVTPLYTESVEWWVRKGHPLANKRRLKAADLVSFPFVSQFMPAPLEAWLDEVDLQVKSKSVGRRITRSLQCSDYAILTRVALESEAVLISPRQIILKSGQADGFVSIPLPKYPGIVVSAAVPRFPSPSPLARRFVEMLQEAARELVDTAAGDPEQCS